MHLRKFVANRIAPAHHRIAPVVLLLTVSIVSYACSVEAGRRDCERLNADAIFVGRVLEIKPVMHHMQDQAWSADSMQDQEWPGYSMQIAVEDSLQGNLGKEVTVETGSGGGDCGTPLPVGGRYLIFAYKDSDGQLWTGIDTTELHAGDPASAKLVENWRKLVTPGHGSLFGNVSYEAPRGYDTQGHLVAGAPGGSVANMVIRAVSADKTFTTTTTPDGRYEFSDLPNGTYEVTPALEPGQTYDKEFYSARYIKAVGDGSCERVDFPLRSITRLKGRILIPKGQQFAFIPEFSEVLVQTVAAVPVGVQKPTERTGFASPVDPDGSFDIWPIAPGDYYVGININTSPTPVSPFVPTYYPGVTDKAKARIVHIDAGETKYIEMPEPGPVQNRTVYIEAVGMDGKPLPKVRVQRENLQSPGDPTNFTLDVTLDADGSGTISVYSGIAYHLHASSLGGWRSFQCAEAVTVQAGYEPVRVRFVMDRVDGPDDRYRNGLASGLCDIAVVDDPRATAAIRALNARATTQPAAPASGPASPPAAPANNKP
jgi:hypothetical protein